MSLKFIVDMQTAERRLQEHEYITPGSSLSLVSEVYTRLRSLKPFQILTLRIGKTKSGTAPFMWRWGILEHVSVTPKKKAGSSRRPTSPSPKSRRPKTTASRGKKRGD